MKMNVNGVLTFFFVISEIFIGIANSKEAPNTYVLRYGVAKISFDIDTKAADGFYVDVFNPRNKKIFQCLGTSPEAISVDFKGKINLSGENKTGSITFFVLNSSVEDAGKYRSVIEMRKEEIGSQTLVVFDQFQKPKISATKTVGQGEEISPTLTCQVETNGMPPELPIPVSYIWKRNGVPVEHSGKYGIQKSALTIKDLRRSEQTDIFTCLAKNDYGAMSPESNALNIAQYFMKQGICDTSCINGVCSGVAGNITCKCDRGWTGPDCSTDIDECSSNPCHAGKCYGYKYGEYLCVCNAGWTGKQCDSDINECAGNPCANDGTCKDLANDYICHCTPGWTGKNCNIEINECQSNPCQQGTCKDLPQAYQCSCDDEWTGKNCETAIDACSGKDCFHGKCEVKMNSSKDYDCICEEGWSGKNCNVGASSTLNIPGLVAGCAIIVVILLIVGIWYRRNKAGVYMDGNINSEEVYNDVKRIQSGEYWTIDDEQIYDIRRRIKSAVLVEVDDANSPDDYPNLQSEPGQTVMDGKKITADGYLNPTFTMSIIKDAPRNDPNFSQTQNDKQDDHTVLKE